MLTFIDREYCKVFLFTKDAPMKKTQKLARLETTGVQKPVGLLCRAFAANLDEKALFLKMGYEENEIYTHGLGAENFEECLWSFRGRPGDP